MIIYTGYFCLDRQEQVKSIGDPSLITTRINPDCMLLELGTNELAKGEDPCIVGEMLIAKACELHEEYGQ